MMSTAAAPALSVAGLTVAYDAQPVLWNAGFQVPRGVMMGVVGPNGAGKSTLLKAILGVIPKLAGRIEVFGRQVSTGGAEIGYVPQRASVDWDFPTTVFDLVLMGTYGQLGWFRRPGKAQREAAWQALDRVEMRDFAHRQIGELSGGQQQRAFLARAFVQDAPLYFMDEPFAGVDATTERSLVRLLQQMRQEGKTMVIVHHDLATVSEYFDQVTLLNRQVIACGDVSAAFNRETLKSTYGGAFSMLDSFRGEDRSEGERASDPAAVSGPAATRE